MRDAHRSAGVAGLCFTAATVVAFSLQPSIDFDATATAFAEQLAAGKSAVLASGVAMAVAAAALHWFLAALSRVVDPSGDEPAAAVLAPAGAVAGTLLALGFLSVGALAAWAPQGGADAAAVQTAGRMANTATNVALLPLAGAGLAVGRLAFRRAALPVWIGALGVVAAGMSIVAAGRAADELGFLALLLWLVWSAALGVTLLRREAAPRRAAAAA